jgi:hypothetical protein
MGFPMPPTTGFHMQPPGGFPKPPDAGFGGEEGGNPGPYDTAFEFNDKSIRMAFIRYTQNFELKLLRIYLGWVV